MAANDVVIATRERLGSVGVWLGSLRPASIDEERVVVGQIEGLGYGSLWTGEGIGGKEAFAHQALLLAASDRIVTGTGIANVWARQPATMQGGANTLGSGYPGRFILGLGVSHASMVSRSGQSYERPLAHAMVDYLDRMDAALAGTPRSDAPVPRVLAALRPQMLALARDRTDGAHPYFVPPAHTLAAREILGADKLLVPEQAVVLISDPSEARSAAREHMSGYLQMPNYVNNLRHLGYGDEDLSGGGSDRLVDAIVAWGDEEDILRRVLRAPADHGADHVLLQPLGALQEAVRQLQLLAPAVLAS